MTEAEQLREQIAAHKAEQEKMNDLLIKNIDKMGVNIERLTDTVSRIDVFQAELNNVSSRVDRNDSDIKDISKAVADINSKIAVTSEFKNQITWLVRAVMAAMIAGMFGLFWWLIKGA